MSSKVILNDEEIKLFTYMVMLTFHIAYTYFCTTSTKAYFGQSTAIMLKKEI